MDDTHPGATVCIQVMEAAHLPQVLLCWQEAEGVGLSAEDSMDALVQYLVRNPRGSFVAMDGEHLVGAVLCGHDGRRGYIHHLAVATAYRGRGIGRRLVTACLERLAEQSIHKCHAFVFQRNRTGRRFWETLGWTARDDLLVHSHRLGEVGEANGGAE